MILRVLQGTMRQYELLQVVLKILRGTTNGTTSCSTNHYGVLQEVSATVNFNALLIVMNKTEH